MITLITSGDYVNAEMKAEFGQLPPAMLPLGTWRLIDHQVQALKEQGQDRQIFLSLPESYALGEATLSDLEANGVKLISVPDGLSLGQSVLHCIEQGQFSGPCSILHGDTLLDVPSSELTNTHLIGDRVGGYAWGHAVLDNERFTGATPLSQGEENDGPVLVGYFSFSCAQEFAKALLQVECNFLEALGRHASEVHVQARWCPDWSDFGHLQTYYRSRAAFASSRAFNNLQISDSIVQKWSSDSDKINAESDWYSNLPARLHPYTARLIDAGATETGWQYSTEYEHLPTLQELFIFGRLDHVTWDEILGACVQCLEAFADTDVADAPQDAAL
ncbi:hypothetical protein KMP13_11545 [Epibacterium ulvae]|uniref:hypothetical protein n=1 Tax=Epibacterium ulvae TaxID=1156985 RepID=UPI001BFCD154|nr:hypothetical protein [Epibacterium ulvae]MBT8154520.1 hypothetical protein [Epibacterium ulvae]